MERIGECDQFEALGISLFASILVIGARRFDRTFNRLSARISEKDRISEGRIDELLRQLFTLWTAIKI